MPTLRIRIAALPALSATSRASLLMLVVAASNATDTAIIRIVAEDLHPLEIGFFRNLFSLLLILPWLYRAGPGVFRTSRLSVHVARAVIKLAALVSLFYAITIMPLADVTAIAFTTPLFVVLGAVLFLGETMRFRRWGAILIGFLGVLVVLRPGTAVFDPRMLAAVASAIGLAAIALLLKFLSGREPLATIVGLNLVITVPLALLLMLPVWITPGLDLLGLMVLQGALGALGQFSAARAMALADASFLMPIEFVRLPLVVILAYVAFGELADLWTWAGAALIFVSTFYLARRGAGLSAPRAGEQG
jgi:drug/metabolite transporter (DMT)-like permease